MYTMRYGFSPGKYSRTGARCLPPAATILAATPSTSGSCTQKRNTPVFQHSKLFSGLCAFGNWKIATPTRMRDAQRAPAGAEPRGSRWAA